MAYPVTPANGSYFGQMTTLPGSMTAAPPHHVITPTGAAFGQPPAVPFGHVMGLSGGLFAGPPSGVPAFGAGPPSVNATQVLGGPFQKPTILIRPLGWYQSGFALPADQHGVNQFGTSVPGTGGAAAEAAQASKRYAPTESCFEDGALIFTAFRISKEKGCELRKVSEASGDLSLYVSCHDNDATRERYTNCYEGVACSGSSVNFLLRHWIEAVSRSNSCTITPNLIMDLICLAGVQLQVRNIRAGAQLDGGASLSAMTMPHGNRMRSNDHFGVLTQTHMLARTLNVFLLTDWRQPVKVGASVYVCLAKLASGKYVFFALCDNGESPPPQHGKPEIISWTDPNYPAESRHTAGEMKTRKQAAIDLQTAWQEILPTFHSSHCNAEFSPGHDVRRGFPLVQTAVAAPSANCIVARRCIGRGIHPPEYLHSPLEFNHTAWLYWTMCLREGASPDSPGFMDQIQRSAVSTLKHIDIDLRN